MCMHVGLRACVPVEAVQDKRNERLKIFFFFFAEKHRAVGVRVPGCDSDLMWISLNAPGPQSRREERSRRIHCWQERWNANSPSNYRSIVRKDFFFPPPVAFWLICLHVCYVWRGACAKDTDGDGEKGGCTRLLGLCCQSAGKITGLPGVGGAGGNKDMCRC